MRAVFLTFSLIVTINAFSQAPYKSQGTIEPGSWTVLSDMNESRDGHTTTDLAARSTGQRDSDPLLHQERAGFLRETPPLIRSPRPPQQVRHHPLSLHAVSAASLLSRRRLDNSGWSSE